MIISEEDYLAHYGILRKSGRYPWGSGETQSERNKTFLSMVDDLRNKGMSEAEVARGLGLTTPQLRAAKSIAKNEEKLADISQAQRLKNHGLSNVAIGQRMGINESSVRDLLKPGETDKAKVLDSTVAILKDQVDKKHYVDIGSGVEYHMNISNNKLKIAVAKLEEEGYTVHYVKVDQLGTGKQTTIKVLAAPDTTYSEVIRNKDQIKTVPNYSEDGGRNYLGIKPPTSISSKRVGVRYGPEGGTAADGLIYVRRGVEDISLGASNYAQVRIAVDGSHYLKGMAMYRDDLPDGVDLVFNTNKNKTDNKLDAMKKMGSDPDSPFGAMISRQNGVMNIVNEQGDWEKWSKSLSTQMLSKQTPALAKEQLDETFDRKKRELDEISSSTNPAVKKRLLESYADDADSSAVHLKAAALPRQASHVILPMTTIKENEVYAPNYKDGDRVVLVRYPHGGIFEIPELTVNNRLPEGKKLIGTNAPDAIGIHSKVAERLSGADFDGDTVLVIPNPHGKIKTEPALKGLIGFDPQMYKLPDDSPIPRMSPRTKQVEMGKISNLIADMSLRGASSDEKARAVRHSMVVIDGEKHNLNYRQSAKDNGITQLRIKYQKSKQGGASTLISNSGTTSTAKVAERKQGFKVDPDTGKKIYTETGASYVDKKTGKTVVKTENVPRLSVVDDAHQLSSGTPIEKIYADHSNRLKNLANQARKEALNTKPIAYSPEAKEKYAPQVEKLNADLNLALRNSPLERQAQVLANAIVSRKKEANPDMDKSELKKIKAQALTEARLRTGAKKQRIEIDDEQWAAIQAGAITNNKLKQILANADLDVVKKLATPREDVAMRPAKISKAISLLRAGYTQAEVAEALGVSVSTLKRSVSGVS